MAICRRGHPSTDDEYCDQCGAQITPDLDVSDWRADSAGARVDSVPIGELLGLPDASADREVATRAAAEREAAAPEPSDSAAVERCPVCEHPRVARYCEPCGYDFVTGTPSSDGATGDTTRRAPPELTAEPAAPPVWVAVVGADRTYFDRVIAEGGPDAGRVSFPPYCPERPVLLTGDEIRIGRYSRGRPVRPEIDLSEPPKDPGVSHLHAVLLAQPDGGWTLVDPGSANGTLVNGRLVEPNVPVPVRGGDRIHLGAWTVITLREGNGGAAGGAS